LNFLNSPNVDFGLMNVDVGSSLHQYAVALLDNSAFYADSGATAHCTHLNPSTQHCHYTKGQLGDPRVPWSSGWGW
jgi:hypothetical protein